MTIPATHAEIEQLYLEAELKSCRTLCVTACNPGDGVTSVASALAERYLLGGHKTLLVDLNLFNPAFDHFDLLANSADEEPWIEHKKTHQVFTGLSIPKNQSTLLAYKDPKQMANAVLQWQNEFDRVIVDTSPLLQINRGNVPAQSVATACDRTILVVRGGSNTESQVKKATEMLTNDKINLLGTVLNVVDQPSLGEEMIRELRRIPFLPSSIRRRIESWVRRNDLLSQVA
ncbi:CpsD/CapB family tyrosine-protein kinase [Vibrio mexicanus]|uniref:CpsD/CapB family tyrosine-protein kinase n=1 Tax=Vibrio mexicanus TaxID=1004326 RepID=UPI00063CE5C8|nr:CpsD/CapB family tyrosine-protein kinase [Vibrio mexicanus]